MVEILDYLVGITFFFNLSFITVGTLIYLFDDKLVKENHPTVHFPFLWCTPMYLRG